MIDPLDTDLLLFFFNSASSVVEALGQYILTVTGSETLEEARLLIKDSNELAILFSILEQELKGRF